MRVYVDWRPIQSKFFILLGIRYKAAKILDGWMHYCTYMLKFIMEIERQLSSGSLQIHELVVSPFPQAWPWRHTATGSESRCSESGRNCGCVYVTTAALGLAALAAPGLFNAPVSRGGSIKPSWDWTCCASISQNRRSGIQRLQGTALHLVSVAAPITNVTAAITAANPQQQSQWRAKQPNLCQTGAAVLGKVSLDPGSNSDLFSQG